MTAVPIYENMKKVKNYLDDDADNDPTNVDSAHTTNSPPKGCILPTFDVYKPSPAFRKKTARDPDFMVLILKSTDPFPTLTQLEYLRRTYGLGRVVDGRVRQMHMAVLSPGSLSFGAIQ